ncbi:helix-turn-helix domain-containing protein [Candidatus Gracilibacteria bacterium 28_42_T64]|nr:helix-turn-helix domain-containing protein [Candidatus Gracilibacteria bacterium 28_42_T64]
MYKYTRQEVANRLSISTRSVDRYIKAGKLRAKKEGKVVYVKGSDVENILSGSSVKQEVIMPNAPVEENMIQKKSETSSGGGLDMIYKDLRSEIAKKDEIIQNLSINLGRYEEVAKNSVSLIEFKKSQFLLDESRGYLNKEIEDLKTSNDKLTGDLKYEKTSNLLLIVFVIALLIISGTVWFMQI